MKYCTNCFWNANNDATAVNDTKQKEKPMKNYRK